MADRCGWVGEGGRCICSHAIDWSVRWCRCGCEKLRFSFPFATVWLCIKVVKLGLDLSIMLGTGGCWRFAR